MDWALGEERVNDNNSNSNDVIICNYDNNSHNNNGNTNDIENYNHNDNKHGNNDDDNNDDDNDDNCTVDRALGEEHFSYRTFWLCRKMYVYIYIYM